MNDNSLFLKIAIDSEFLIVRSNLNQSLNVGGKKEFLKQFVLQWNVGIWLVLVLTVSLHFRIKFVK